MKKSKINANAEVWEVKVSDSVLDSIHGFRRAIKEFHIPKENISFNIVNDKVHVFNTPEDRYRNYGTEGEQNNGDIALNLGSVHLDPAFVKFLANYVKGEKELEARVMMAILDAGDPI